MPRNGRILPLIGKSSPHSHLTVVRSPRVQYCEAVRYQARPTWQIGERFTIVEDSREKALNTWCRAKPSRQKILDRPTWSTANTQRELRQS